MSGDDQEREVDQPRLDELIFLREAADMSGLSQGHLGFLIHRSELWGKKIGHNRATTEKAVKVYLAGEHRPGPKPNQCQTNHKKIDNFIGYLIQAACN